jgi:hypothetical protein
MSVSRAEIEENNLQESTGIPKAAPQESRGFSASAPRTGYVFLIVTNIFRF